MNPLKLLILLLIVFSPASLLAQEIHINEGTPMLERYFASVQVSNGVLHLRTKQAGARYVVISKGETGISEYGQSFIVEASPVEFKGRDFTLNLVPIQISGVGIIGVKETIDRRSVGGSLETTYAAVPIMSSELPKIPLDKVKTLIDKSLSDLNLDDQKPQ
jgi:hypothetical protein